MRKFKKIQEEKQSFNKEFNKSKISNNLSLFTGESMLFENSSFGTVLTCLQELNSLSQEELKSLYFYTLNNKHENNEKANIKLFIMEKMLET